MSEVILHISAGQGPKECQWVVKQIANAFVREAKAQALKCHILEPGEETTASLLLSVSGDQCDAFVADRVGTIRWIGTSPFRPKHKRKNWYVGVSFAPTIDDISELKDKDIKYQAIRASGPGGQHVNKTDSAVRATHIPTGINVVSQDQRSQFANKKIARTKLALKFVEQEQQGEADSKSVMWRQNRELERGDEVRCYEGMKFRMRKKKM